MAPSRAVLILAVGFAIVSRAAGRCIPPTEAAEMHPFCCFHQTGGYGQAKACNKMAGPNHWCSQSAKRCTYNCNGIWYGPSDDEGPTGPSKHVLERKVGKTHLGRNRKKSVGYEPSMRPEYTRIPRRKTRRTDRPSTRKKSTGYEPSMRPNYTRIPQRKVQLARIDSRRKRSTGYEPSMRPMYTQLPPSSVKKNENRPPLADRKLPKKIPLHKNSLRRGNQVSRRGDKIPHTGSQKPQRLYQKPQIEDQKPERDSQKPQIDNQKQQRDTLKPQIDNDKLQRENQRLQHAGNPFAAHRLFINPTFTKNIMKSVKTAKSGVEKTNLMIMSMTPTAYWVDARKKALPGSTSLESVSGILKKAASYPTPPVVTFVVYNLPNRDCAAEASNGELCCGGKTALGQCDFLDASRTGNCEGGLKKYREEYIDQIAVSVKQFCNKVPLAFVIEPDSLPNFVTNLENAKCGATSTQASYRNGISYASHTLAAACPTATQYLDAAHGGWMGWDNNRQGFMEEVKQMHIAENLRGFALNVANYQPLGTMCPEVGFCLDGKNADHPCCLDPCKLSSRLNACNTEMNYAAALRMTMKAGIPGFDPKMIIDTGRNGQNSRKSCLNWCNVRGAGAGVLPTAHVPHPDVVDAFLWLKTPGESDGCTEELPEGGKCLRFDPQCTSEDSIGSHPGEPRDPGAGGWFDYQVKMLARNAQMLGQ